VDFRSAEQAVKFAFNVSDRAEYARSDPLAVRGTSEQGLSPMDLHAQAAMIQSQIGRLLPQERDSILSMYGRGRERADAIRALSAHLYPSLKGSLPGTREVSIIVCHWATRRPPIRAIAEDRGVSYRKVCAWRSAVLRAWMPLYTRAIGKLHDNLVAGGVEIG
jgi:hypothetical protein